jgi:hypothetical protein
MTKEYKKALDGISTLQNWISQPSTHNLNALRWTLFLGVEKILSPNKIVLTCIADSCLSKTFYNYVQNQLKKFATKSPSSGIKLSPFTWWTYIAVSKPSQRV